MPDRAIGPIQLQRLLDKTTQTTRYITTKPPPRGERSRIDARPLAGALSAAELRAIVLEQLG
jgi:hypothetical protein